MLSKLKTRVRTWIWNQSDARPFRLVMGFYLAGLVSCAALVLVVAIAAWTLR